MKHVRLELQFIARIHVGADVSAAGGEPRRTPDAQLYTVLSRTLPLPDGITVASLAKGWAVNTALGAAPLVGERLRLELDQKGL